jgi:hypothetical protein
MKNKKKKGKNTEHPPKFIGTKIEETGRWKMGI